MNDEWFLFHEYILIRLSIEQKYSIITITNTENQKPKLFKEFPGFFFKKFNLTSYKKERSESRERSKSPEYKYKPNHKRGNGVPDDLLKRLKYIYKIVNNENFMKYYQNRPKGKKVKFDEIFNYTIINYFFYLYKKNNK